MVVAFTKMNNIFVLSYILSLSYRTFSSFQGKELLLDPLLLPTTLRSSTPEYDLVSAARPRATVVDRKLLNLAASNSHEEVYGFFNPHQTTTLIKPSELRLGFRHLVTKMKVALNLRSPEKTYRVYYDLTGEVFRFSHHEALRIFAQRILDLGPTIHDQKAFARAELSNGSGAVVPRIASALKLLGNDDLSIRERVYVLGTLSALERFLPKRDDGKVAYAQNLSQGTSLNRGEYELFLTRGLFLLSHITSREQMGNELKYGQDLSPSILFIHCRQNLNHRSKKAMGKFRSSRGSAESW